MVSSLSPTLRGLGWSWSMALRSFSRIASGGWRHGTIWTGPWLISNSGPGYESPQSLALGSNRAVQYRLADEFIFTKFFQAHSPKNQIPHFANRCQFLLGG